MPDTTETAPRPGTRRETIPPPEVLAAYAADLPPIYRQILGAYQTAQHGRLAGESLAVATIQMHLRNLGHRYEFESVLNACMELFANGFLDNTTRAYESFAPTPVGEALVAAVTGRPTPARVIPRLPAPPW